MARENRAENRAKAKEAAGGAGAAGTPPEELNKEDEQSSKQSFDDIINADEDTDDEVSDSVGVNSEAESGEKEEDEKENAAGSEIEGRTQETPPVVKKEGEEEAKKAEEEAGKKAAEALEADGDKAKKPEEQKATEKPAEPAAKAEPTSEEKEKERAKPLSDEEATKLFSDWRNETEGLLAEHHYKMTEKDVEEFNENPAAWVPKAMSRVYLDCISASFQQFATYLPRMVDQVIEMRKNTDARESKFFEQWQELKPHKETVLRLGAAYRASNPTASEDDFIREVGAQAMVALRLTPNGMQQQQQQPEQKPAFTPAAQTPTLTPPKQQSNNPFEQMTSDFSFEELPEDA